jgi:hypothetical protein
MRILRFRNKFEISKIWGSNVKICKYGSILKIYRPVHIIWKFMGLIAYFWNFIEAIWKFHGIFGGVKINSRGV